MHLEPPTTPLIKIKHDDKPYKYFVKIKLCRDPTSYLSDLYDFKMALFENGDPEELLLFAQNFNRTLAESGTLTTGAKIQHLCTLVRG